MSSRGRRCFVCGKTAVPPHFRQLTRGKRTAGYKPVCNDCKNRKSVGVLLIPASYADADADTDTDTDGYR